MLAFGVATHVAKLKLLVRDLGTNTIAGVSSRTKNGGSAIIISFAS
jgi:hypothetical protein